MTLRNRVTPLGELIASPHRGTVYGNRGCLHDAHGNIRRGFNGKRWIACRLEFRGWQRGPLMQPGRFTELFFLDEATALAAGHRPCFCCRREAATDFLGRAGFLKRADAFDLLVHGERLDGAGKRRSMHDLATLPDGAVIEEQDDAWAIRGRSLLNWRPDGYGARRDRGPARPVRVLTPSAIVRVLAAGYRPAWHPSAGDDCRLAGH